MARRAWGVRRWTSCALCWLLCHAATSYLGPEPLRPPSRRAAALGAVVPLASQAEAPGPGLGGQFALKNGAQFPKAA